MRMIKLGKTGKEISKMGLGTWSIGGGSAWGGDHDLQTVVDTICEAPKVGINLIDTAPGYNFGNSEKIVGMALKKMNREGYHSCSCIRTTLLCAFGCPCRADLIS